jgi:hypothetical protein
LGATLLVAYSGLLGLGSWREEIRPDRLDAAHEFATGFWNSIGIKTGLAVFGGENDQGLALREMHLAVLPISAAGRGEAIRWRANEGRSFAGSYDPGETIVLHLLIQLTSQQARLPAASGPVVGENPMRLLKALARHFQSRIPPHARSDVNGMVAFWWNEHVHCESGATLRAPKLLGRWRIAQSVEVDAVWDPIASQIKQAGLAEYGTR